MAQEFTVNISDALWADVKSKLSSEIDPSISGDITVERMTTYLNTLLDFTLVGKVKRVKTREYKASLEE
tara:strand:+ start:1242 stop:1448 length:207 start_codon:yes stop_codon:yes gene_type:complete